MPKKSKFILTSCRISEYYQNFLNRAIPKFSGVAGVSPARYPLAGEIPALFRFQVDGLFIVKASVTNYLFCQKVARKTPVLCIFTCFRSESPKLGSINPEPE